MIDATLIAACLEAAQRYDEEGEELAARVLHQAAAALDAAWQEIAKMNMKRAAASVTGACREADLHREVARLHHDAQQREQAIRALIVELNGRENYAEHIWLSGRLQAILAGAATQETQEHQ